MRVAPVLTLLLCISIMLPRYATNAACNLPADPWGDAYNDIDFEILGESDDAIEHDIEVSIDGDGEGNDFQFTFYSEPVTNDETVYNKNGTEVTFTEDGDPLKWKTSKINWFGLESGKCRKDVSEYKISLQVMDTQNSNTGCLIEKTFRVTWGTSDEPECIPSVSSSSKSTISTPIVDPDNSSQWRCELTLAGFTKTGTVVNLPTTGQYKDDIKKEEDYHEKQFEGAVALDQGGTGDLWTAKGLEYFLQKKSYSTKYYYSTISAADAKKKAQDALAEVAELENTESWRIFTEDRGFIELKAKEHVGWTEGISMECTYDITHPDQSNHTHPAWVQQ